jgi:hypothetical protein
MNEQEQIIKALEQRSGKRLAALLESHLHNKYQALARADLNPEDADDMTGLCQRKGQESWKSKTDCRSVKFFPYPRSNH